jgi:hypothetical protein
MKFNSVVVAIAFLLGLGMAMFFNRSVSIAPLAHAADVDYSKVAPFNPNAQYYTASADGMTVVVWCFDSSGADTANNGPTLKWAKVYHPDAKQ